MPKTTSNINNQKASFLLNPKKFGVINAAQTNRQKD